MKVNNGKDVKDCVEVDDIETMQRRAIAGRMLIGCEVPEKRFYLRF